MPKCHCFIHAASPEFTSSIVFYLSTMPGEKLAVVRWVDMQEANYSKNEDEGARTLYMSDLSQVTHGHNSLWD